MINIGLFLRLLLTKVSWSILCNVNLLDIYCGTLSFPITLSSTIIISLSPFRFIFGNCSPHMRPLLALFRPRPLVLLALPHWKICQTNLHTRIHGTYVSEKIKKSLQTLRTHIGFKRSAWLYPKLSTTCLVFTWAKLIWLASLLLPRMHCICFKVAPTIPI